MAEPAVKFAFDGVISEINKDAGRGGDHDARPGGLRADGYAEARRATGERHGFRGYARKQRFPMRSHGGPHDRAEGQAFRQFMKRDPDEESQSYEIGSLFGDAKRPPVQETMQADGDQQRGGETVQRRRATVMIVRVRTGGADRMHVMIDDPQQAESGRHPEDRDAPPVMARSFGHNPEERNGDQQGAANRQNIVGNSRNFRQARAEEHAHDRQGEHEDERGKDQFLI